MPPKFSLSEFVRAVYTETAEVDPDRLTHAVLTALEAIPEADREAAFEQALRSTCQHVLNNVRRSPNYFPGAHSGHDARRTPATGDPKLNSARSWKTRGAAEYWRAKLDTPYPLWDGKNTWVAFGDLTVDALDRASVWHNTLADANRAKATEMHEWAQLLLHHKVATVRELPESVLRERLDKGAAA
jgi:hypothetical protein